MLEFPLWLHILAALIAVLCFFVANGQLSDIWPSIRYWLRGKVGKHPTRPAPLIWLTAIFLVLFGSVAQIIAVWPSSPSTLNDSSSFVYDETYPDDSQVQPGQVFDKQWRLYNKGDTEWKNYEAQFVSKNGIPETDFGIQGYSVEDTLPKHDSIVTAQMTAPLIPGCYRNVYQLFNGTNYFGETFDVQIVVFKPEVKNYALFVDHLNVRDGTNFKLNQPFRKGWIFHNCGTNTWVNYRAVRIAGELIGPAVIPLPITSSHQDVQLWGDFIAPSSLTRLSTATYQLQDGQGHPITNGQFQVAIKTS